MTDQPNGEGAAPADDTAAALDAEFNPQPAAAEAPADDAGAQPEATAEEPAPEPTPKPKQTAQQRIDELTWRAKEAERQRDALLDRIGKAPAQSEEAPPAAAQGPAEPNPDDYDNGEFDRAYIRDLTRYEARQAHEELTSQTKAHTTQAQAVQSFESRVKEQYPDGEPAGLAAIRTMDTLPIALQEIMLESDLGPKLADHYGNNPAELARLSSMTPTQQAREITRQEAAMSVPAEPAKPLAKTSTEAPEPPPTARGAGGQFKPAADTDDFAAFEKAYPA